MDNEQGLIVERTIALRPYPAVTLFRDAMYASLKDKLPPDVWNYQRRRNAKAGRAAFDRRQARPRHVFVGIVQRHSIE